MLYSVLRISVCIYSTFIHTVSRNDYSRRTVTVGLQIQLQDVLSMADLSGMILDVRYHRKRHTCLAYCRVWHPIQIVNESSQIRILF